MGRLADDPTKSRPTFQPGCDLACGSKIEVIQAVEALNEGIFDTTDTAVRVKIFYAALYHLIEKFLRAGHISSRESLPRKIADAQVFAIHNPSVYVGSITRVKHFQSSPPPLQIVSWRAEVLRRLPLASLMMLCPYFGWMKDIGF